MIEVLGVRYFAKQEALDHVENCRKKKIPIHGIEVVSISGTNIETSMYKTIWFSGSRGVYNAARNFIQKQMAGTWNYAEFKQ